MNKYQKLLQEIETEKELQDSLHRDSKVLIVDGMNLFIRTFSYLNLRARVEKSSANT